MNICIPRERRPFEFRVGLSPAGVEALCQNGHTVFVEHDAGLGARFADKDYEQAGARILYSVDEVFGRADVLMKIARPTDQEMEWLRPNTMLLGLLHMASARRSKIDLLLKDKITAIAYEQIQEKDGSLPLLRPFSQIGGAMSAQVAARLLQSDQGGSGIILGGIPGVPPAEVVILGGGVTGTFAAKAFLGCGAHVMVLDKDMNALQRVSQCASGIATLPSSERNIAKAVEYADVLVGAVLVPGERAPLLVTREMVKTMKPRSVIIDISIDQGGCIETSRPTTHDQPTFIENGIVHYCVPNMPGVVARTATNGFVNVALPYILDIVNLGVEEAVKKNPAIEPGITTYQGEMRHLSHLSR